MPCENVWWQQCPVKMYDGFPNSSVQYSNAPYRVAGVGWLSGTTAESLKAFVERVFPNFATKTSFFSRFRENRQFVLYESRLSKLSLLIALRKQDLRKLFESCTKSGSLKASRRQALRKLSESSLKALQKQVDFRWKLSQIRMTFVESSMAAFQKARTSRQY